MKFEVTNRFSGAVQFTAEINCAEDESYYVKLGLAVKWAFANRASLVGASLDGARLDRASLDGARLDGASLDGARLDGASLDGASLDGASLDGASLDGASLDGARLDGASLDGALIKNEKISRLIASANRLDGYSFLAFELADGGVKIKAGCRWFTVAEYRAHITREYADTDKAAETSDILDFIEARARRLGVSLEPVKEAAE